MATLREESPEEDRDEGGEGGDDDFRHEIEFGSVKRPSRDDCDCREIEVSAD